MQVMFKKPIKLNHSICLTGMIWGKEFWMLGVSTDYDFNIRINVIQSCLMLSVCILEVFYSFHATDGNNLFIGPMIQNFHSGTIVSFIIFHPIINTTVFLIHWFTYLRINFILQLLYFDYIIYHLNPAPNFNLSQRVKRDWALNFKSRGWTIS